MITAIVNNSNIEIKITDEFTYKLFNEFNDIISLIKKNNIKMVIVDLQKCCYLDSGALGMLLLLRDIVSSVSIHIASEAVNNILHTANFHRLFSIQFVKNC